MKIRGIVAALAAGALGLAASDASAGIHWEGWGDTGSSLGSAQTVYGTPEYIAGTLSGEKDVDMYKVNLGFDGNWTFSTDHWYTGADTVLFLFDSNGKGIQMDNDSASGNKSLIEAALTAGMYYIAVAQYDSNLKARDAQGKSIWTSANLSQADPNGYGASNALAGWKTGNGHKSKTYKIVVNGERTEVPEPVTATLSMMGLGALAFATRRRNTAEREA